MADSLESSENSERGAMVIAAIALVVLFSMATSQCGLRPAIAGKPAKQRQETEYGTPTSDVVYSDGFSMAEYGPAGTAWVLYCIDDQTIHGKLPRQSFREALEVPSEFRPRLSYYSDWNAAHKKDQIDKGHWFDAKDASYDENVEHACFEARNLSPQAKALNEGPWKWLEDRIRGYWKPGTRIFVCCGPLWAPLEGEKNYEVQMVGAIPMAPQHYKTILIDDGGEPRLQAWIFPNRNKNLPTVDAAQVSVDELEAKARLDFWTGLPDELEKKLEASK